MQSSDELGEGAGRELLKNEEVQKIIYRLVNAEK